MKGPPKAYPVKNRPGLWAAKGVDPTTRARKNYFGNSAEEASRKAEASLGVTEDNSLFAFYRTVYLPTVQHRSLNWINQIGWVMDRYVLPEFGHRDFGELKRAELQVFFNRIARDLAPRSVRNIKIVFGGVFRLAMADELIAANPTSFVRLAKPDRPHKQVLTFEQLHRLVEKAHPLAKPFVILAGCAGLRLGEAVGVTRGAISKDGILTVCQQVQQVRGGCLISPTLKTENSYRQIPLPTALMSELLNCRRVSDIWICSDTKGGYVTPKNITRELRAACEAAGIPCVSPHELRHTFISLLENEIEAPRPVVMALAGHARSNVTDGYSHTFSQQLLRWMGRYWDQVSTACSPECWATGAKPIGSVEPAIQLVRGKGHVNLFEGMGW